jgi:hypothetical protein
VDTIALNQENILFTPHGLSRLRYEGKETNEHPEQDRSRAKKAFMTAMAILKLFRVVQERIIRSMRFFSSGYLIIIFICFIFL